MSRHATGEPDPRDLRSRSESRLLGAIVATLTLMTCLVIVVVPMLGSLLVAGAILALFAGVGLAAIAALSLS